MAKNRSIKDAMDARLSSMVLSADAKEEIRRRALEQSEAPKRKKRIPFRRALLSVAAACLVLVFGVAAAASVFPGFETFISQMGEDMRQLVQPVNVISTQQGIRMEVVAAVHDGDTAVAYLSIQDTEGNRIDETTTLYACGFGDTFAFGQMVYFDEATRTATFRLESMETEALAERKVTVAIESILAGAQYFHDADTGLTLASIRDANPAPDTVELESSGSYGMSHGWDEAENDKLWNSMEADYLTMLAPGEDALPVDISGITITNAGMVGDYLHIQSRPQGMERYSSFEFYLDYPEALPEARLAAGEVEYGETEHADGRDYYEYCEYILQVPQGVADEDIRLLAGGVSYQNYIAGNWSMTFVLDSDPPQLEAACDIDMHPWNLYKLTLTSVGVTVYGRGEMREDSDNADVVVTLNDGSVAESSGATRWMMEADDSFSIKNSFNLPIDLNEVKSVTINGQPVSFN